MQYGYSAGSPAELGAFLRARRAGLDPSALGLPDDGRLRRVPGLRREELAQRAHVSIDYIVRLEQGRSSRVSRTVLDALAGALLLSEDERDHLYSLADTTPPVRRPGPPRVAAHLRQLLASMTGTPALVLHRGMDVLAWNHAADLLLTDFSRLAPPERNLIRLTFLDPAFRALYDDWPRVARECVAVLRKEAAHTPDDPALTALVGELSMRDSDFRTWWASHQVRGPRRLRKTYHHPTVGTLTLDVQQFTVDTHPDQLLIAYTAEPHSGSHARLAHLLLE